MNTATGCLTKGFIIEAKNIKKYSIPAIDLLKSPLFNTNNSGYKKPPFYFLLIYSVSPGLMKITAKEITSKNIEKLFVKTNPNNENELLIIPKLLNDIHVVHSTGFCQIANKLMYEAYCEVNEQLQIIKKNLESNLSGKKHIDVKWTKVPMKKRNIFGKLV